MPIRGPDCVLFDSERCFKPGICQRPCGKPGASLLLCLSERQDRYAVRIRYVIGRTDFGFLVASAADEATSAPRAGPSAAVIPEMQPL
jgi:hypothetical protein